MRGAEGYITLKKEYEDFWEFKIPTKFAGISGFLSKFPGILRFLGGFFFIFEFPFLKKS